MSANMPVLSNVKKRTRLSKNRKRNWNKVCDINDVEDFLEDKRFEERIGGAVSEKPSEELFFVQASTEEPKVSKQLKPLKCFQNIGAYSCVPAPVNTDINRYSKRVKRGLENAIVKKSKNLKKVKPRDSVSNPDPVNIDLWADNEEKVDDEIKDIMTFHDEITKERRLNVPRHRYQKPSLLPAVEVPHPGASYNPEFSQHQELLKEAVLVEEHKIQEELHLKRVLTDMFPTKDKAPTQEDILAEMSQGLMNDEEDEEEETESSGYVLRNPPVSADDRLTKAHKRKRKEHKQEARLRAVEKLNRQRLHEIYRIPSLKKEIRKEQQVTEQRIKKRIQRKIDKNYQPRMLSKHKYVAPEIEVNLPEEITGSLRTLKSDGNLLEDRYKSLQRRNIIETRVKQKMKRKYKLKVKVKRSHRNFE